MSESVDDPVLRQDAVGEDQPIDQLGVTRVQVAHRSSLIDHCSAVILFRAMKSRHIERSFSMLVANSAGVSNTGTYACCSRRGAIALSAWRTSSAIRLMI